MLFPIVLWWLKLFLAMKGVSFCVSLFIKEEIISLRDSFPCQWVSCLNWFRSIMNKPLEMGDGKSGMPSLYKQKWSLCWQKGRSEYSCWLTTEKIYLELYWLLSGILYKENKMSTCLQGDYSRVTEIRYPYWKFSCKAVRKKWHERKAVQGEKDKNHLSQVFRCKWRERNSKWQKERNNEHSRLALFVVGCTRLQIYLSNRKEV